MQLSPKDYETIKDLSGEAGFTAREIAISMGLPVKDFLEAFNDRNSDIRQAYERGLLQENAEVNLQVSEQAKAGSFTAIQIRQKAQRISQIENVRANLISGDI